MAFDPDAYLSEFDPDAYLAASKTLTPEQIAKQKEVAYKSMVRAERGPVRNVIGDVAAGAMSLGAKVLDIPSKMFNAPWLKSELGQTQELADKNSWSYLGGGMLDPLAQAAGSGAFAAASRAPAIPKLTEATSNYAKNILAGGATGAGLSSAQGGDAVEGGLFGAGLTAAIGNPALAKSASKLSSTAKNVGNSLYAVISKGGRASTAQKMVLDNIPVSERDTILKVLESQGMDVSALGSELTSAQTIAQSRIGQSVKNPAGARVAALEAEIGKMPGGEQLNILAAQRAANQSEMMNTLSGGRGAAVDPLLGMSADDVAVANAAKAREVTAKQLYPKGKTKADAALEEIMSRPAVETAAKFDETMAANEARGGSTIGPKRFDVVTNKPIYDEYSLESLANRYRSMEMVANRMSRSADEKAQEMAISIRAAKNDLGKWLANKYPEWAQANKVFGFQSKPINQMEVGAALKDKLEQSPAAFLKATEDIKDQSQLIKMVTGRPNQTLADVYNLGQMSKISGLRNEAQITKEVEKLQGMAKASLGDERAFQLPNLLNVWVAVANKIARETAKATVDDVTSAAADVLANPAKLRALLNEDKMRRAMFSKPITGERMAPAVSGIANVRGMMSGEQQ